MNGATGAATSSRTLGDVRGRADRASSACPSPDYLLDQQPAENSERERLALIERFHDPISQAHLERLGVARGWRCLDIGAGAGSIARWLARRVLPDGDVLATDLDTRLLEPLSACGVRVARADIRSGPPAEDTFDLVHARLLLIHLPDRASAVIQMAAAARPGGWVVAGDIDFTSLAALDPWPGWLEVWESFLRLVGHAGWDIACGRRLAALLGGAGLEDVGVEAVGGCVAGGSLPCQIMALTLERVRERLLAMDVSTGDLETALVELRSPARTFVTPTVWTAWGRRTAGSHRHRPDQT